MAKKVYIVVLFLGFISQNMVGMNMFDAWFPAEPSSGPVVHFDDLDWTGNGKKSPSRQEDITHKKVMNRLNRVINHVDECMRLSQPAARESYAVKKLSEYHAPESMPLPVATWQPQPMMPSVFTVSDGTSISRACA